MRVFGLCLMHRDVHVTVVCVIGVLCGVPVHVM